MAFNLPTTGDRISLVATFVDDGGQSTNRTIVVPFDTNIDTSIGNALAIVALMATVSKCAVPTVSVGIDLEDDANPTPAANSNVYLDGRIGVDLVVTANSKTKVGVISFPDPADAVKVATTGVGKWQINLSQADIVALVAAYQAGGDGLLSDGQQVLQSRTGKINPKKGKPKIS